MQPPGTAPARTPDGRYLVVRGRLWRASNPGLAADERDLLVLQLLQARGALRRGAAQDGREAARHQVDDAKRRLGERGPVWWTDGAPDYNRKLVRNTPYAGWFARLGVPDGATPRRPGAATADGPGAAEAGCTGDKLASTDVDNARDTGSEPTPGAAAHPRTTRTYERSPIHTPQPSAGGRGR